MDIFNTTDEGQPEVKLVGSDITSGKHLSVTEDPAKIGLQHFTRPSFEPTRSRCVKAPRTVLCSEWVGTHGLI